jgi:hypothetical protein
MRCSELREKIPLYVADLLEESETVALREHLDSGCPGCAAELAGIREAFHQIPFALEPVEPSPIARARLMAAIRKDRLAASRPGSGFRAVGVPAAAALVAALLGVAVGEWMHRGEIAAFREQVAGQAEELAQLKREMRRARESIVFVSSPAVKVVDLAGKEPVAAARARVFWDRRRDAWQIYADNLPAAGSGKTYQLWIVTAEAKISAGTFDTAQGPEAGGTVSVPATAGDPVAFAITDEPAGGSVQPTGSILLLGTI